MGAFDLASVAAVAASGILPSWEEQSAYDAIPDSATDGINLFLSSDPSIYALSDALAINVRKLGSAARSAVITIGTLDATATYTVTLGGHACVYDASMGDGLLATVLAGIAAAIVSSGVVATASVSGSSVVIVGVSATDYSITMGATGSGVIDIDADPASCTAALYVFDGPNASQTWGLVAGGAIGTVSAQGYRQNLTTASWTRVYVYCSGLNAVAGDSGSLTYSVAVWHGVCETGT